MDKRFVLVSSIDTFTQGIGRSIDNLANSSLTERSKEANAISSAVAGSSWKNWFMSRSLETGDWPAVTRRVGKLRKGNRVMRHGSQWQCVRDLTRPKTINAFLASFSLAPNWLLHVKSSSNMSYLSVSLQTMERNI